MINSDHWCFTTEQKEKYRDDITKIPMGLPGVETRNTVFYTDSVPSGRLSVERFVELTSTNVAKILGLYPRKGAIVPGSDADVVIFDPTIEWDLKDENQHMATDYTPFSGKSMKGKSTTTIVDGEVIVENENLVGGKVGKFVPTSGNSAKQTFKGGV